MSDLPKGTLNTPRQTYTLNTNDQLLTAEQYNNLVIAYATERRFASVTSAAPLVRRKLNLIAGWTNQKRGNLLASSVSLEPTSSRRSTNQIDATGAESLYSRDVT